MWRSRWWRGYWFSVAASVVVILLCVVGQCLAFDRSDYSVAMTAYQAGMTSHFTGAIISETSSEYLIATCSHGAAQRDRVEVRPHGRGFTLPARVVWYSPRTSLDLSLWAVSRHPPDGHTWQLASLPPPGRRSGIGEYLVGWGYPARSKQPKKFGGYVIQQGLWSSPAYGKGPWDRINAVVIGGDSGSVLWNAAGQPVGVLWGSSPEGGHTTYTPLVYAPPLWEQETQWRAVGGCQICPQPRIVVPGRVRGPVRIRPPPANYPPEAPQPESPPTAPPSDPECCKENAEAIAGLRESITENGKSLAELRASVDELSGLVYQLGKQLEGKADLADLPDLSGYATRADLQEMEARLLVAINQQFSEIPSQPIPEPQHHIVVMADAEAYYWPELRQEIDKTKGYYPVRVAPPNPNNAGVMPRAVEFINGTPVKTTYGLRDVVVLLQRVSRGSYTGPTS